MISGENGSLPVSGGGAVESPNLPHRRVHEAPVERTPSWGPAGREPSVPSQRSLLAADLVTLGCPADNLCHLVDDAHHAEVLASASAAFSALCGETLVAESLCADPRPACLGCLRAAAPRLAAVASAGTHRRRASLWPSLLGSLAELCRSRPASDAGR